MMRVVLGRFSALLNYSILRGGNEQYFFWLAWFFRIKSFEALNEFDTQNFWSFETNGLQS